MGTVNNRKNYTTTKKTFKKVFESPGDPDYHIWKGGRHLKSPKFEHIFVAVITFSPFFCANTFDTRLLLIVCVLI